ncbi:RecX family transcriptional regulator [Paenibacillus paeoniae]|uniref:Regulatory protein RecX n=2 Tax=Paenibacillus paeoniae TaxID=2292705 RepID=A0A371PQ46_9BACL|nr:RecX family transcriptional regulator [Paenibacillus paeoniae]
MNKEDEWIIGTVKRDRTEKRRYLVFPDTDTEEPLLSVHEDMLIRFQLLKGQMISKEQLEEIKNEDERYKAYALAIAYLGAKPRTRKAIGQYLSRKELQEENIEYALNRLESEQLVDDEQYARQFASSRMRSGLKGRLMIRQELQQRGVPKEVAAEALTELDRDSELNAAKRLAEKKSKAIKGDMKQRKTKLMAFLMRRGFPGDIVREAMRGIEWKDEDSEEQEDDGVLLDN